MTRSAGTSIERQRAPGEQRPPLLRRSDLAYLGALPAAFLVAAFASDDACNRLCRLLARLAMRWRPAASAAEADRIVGLLAGDGVPKRGDRILEGVKANYHLERLQLLRCHRPGGWRPRTALHGREHVDRALSRGNGAILWVGHSPWRHLMAKAALHAAGFAVSHLSRPEHGFSKTRLGMRLINPIQIAAERRLVVERIVISSRGIGAVREIERRLAGNGLVSIIANANAQRTIGAPFLTGTLRLSTGPPKLALQTGAALLPVYPIREADDRFVTFVGPPLGPDPGEDRERRLNAMLAGYAAFIEGFVRRWPDQFAGWHDVAPATAFGRPADPMT